MAIITEHSVSAPVPSASAFNQALRVKDMKDKIFMLEPSITPLALLMSKLNKSSCFSAKFEWPEDRPMPISDTVNGTFAATATDILVDTGANFSVNSVWRVPGSGEVIYVTAVATNTITVVRGVGSETGGDGVAAAQINDGWTLVYLGGASEEASSAPVPRQVNPTNEYNYCQIFRTSFAVSNTEKASKYYGGARLPYLHKARGIDHGKGIENAAFWGARSIQDASLSTWSTDAARRFTGGVFEIISTNSKDHGSAINFTTIQDASVLDFRYGRDSKLLFVSRAAVSKINQVSSLGGSTTVGALTMYPSDKTFGLDIRELIAVGGRYQIIPHPLFIGEMDDIGVVVDMDNLGLRTLRDTKLLTNRQAPDLDGQEDEFLSEVGFERRLEETHGKWLNIL